MELNEIKNIIKTQIIEVEFPTTEFPNFDFDLMWELFCDIIENNEQLSQIFEELQNSVDIENLCLKNDVSCRKALATLIETFMKICFNLMNQTIKGAFGECLNRFFDDAQLLKDENVRNNFFAHVKNNPTFSPESFVKHGEKIVQFKKTYELRNALVHSGFLFGNVKPQSSTAATDIQNLLVVYFHFLFHYSREIAYGLYVWQNKLRESILKDVKAKFIEHKDYFIPLKSFEIDSNVEETALTEEDILDSSHLRQGKLVELLETNTIFEPHFMISGEAGTGKSTTIYYLAYKQTEKAQKQDNLAPIPLCLDIRNLYDIKNNRTISIVAELEDLISKNMLGKWIKWNFAAIYLDGLNEAFNKNVKETLFNEIQKLIKQNPNLRIAITSRQNEYFRTETRDNAKTIPCFRLMKMDYDQVKLFIHSFTPTHSQRIVEATEKYSQNTDFLEVIGRPLFAKAIVVAAVANLDRNPNLTDNEIVPPTKPAIIEKLIAELYHREIVIKQNSVFRENQTAFKSILAFIGYQMIEKFEQNAPVRAETLINWIQQRKKNNSFDNINPDWFIKTAVDDFAILKKVTKGIDESFLFAHQEFAAFFHAKEEINLDEQD